MIELLCDCHAFPWRVGLCKLFNIPVFIHMSLIVYIVYSLHSAEAAVVNEANQAGAVLDYGKAVSVAISCLIAFAVLFLTVLIHELGHCAGAKFVGGKATGILLWPLGGIASCAVGNGSPGSMLVVALAGPATHVPQYLAWWGLEVLLASAALDQGGVGALWASTCQTALRLQILLALFNLCVPIYPLDCSQVLLSLCRLGGMEDRGAARFISGLSVSSILVLIASMLGVVQIPWLPFGYSPIAVMLVAWMSFQTYQFHRTTNSDPSQHPLFSNSTCQQLVPPSNPSSARSV